MLITFKSFISREYNLAPDKWEIGYWATGNVNEGRLSKWTISTSTLPAISQSCCSFWTSLVKDNCKESQSLLIDPKTYNSATTSIVHFLSSSHPTLRLLFSGSEHASKFMSSFIHIAAHSPASTDITCVVAQSSLWRQSQKFPTTLYTLEDKYFKFSAKQIIRGCHLILRSSFNYT